MQRCPEKPEETLEIEYLPAGGGLALFTAEPEAKTKSFIAGGYEAAYTFVLVYRLATANGEERLTAGETLDRMAAWAERRENWPAPDGNARLRRVERTGARLKERHKDGTEDWQVTVRLSFEAGT